MKTAHQNTHKSQLLFILADDFGELTTAMYFLQGQKISQHSTLAVSGKLMAACNKLGLPVLQYNSYDELIDIIDTVEPDITLLFSGCLLPINSPIRNLINTKPLSKLVKHLHLKKCTILNFDPLSGVSSRSETVLKYRFPFAKGPFKFLSVIVSLMIEHLLKKSYDILRNTTYLYVTPADDFIKSQGIHSTSFFNSSALVNNKSQPSDADNPYWLFIIADTDYQVQCAKHGAKTFINIVKDKLEQTIKQGRKAIFIGPKKLVHSLQQQLTDLNKIELLKFCPFDQYKTLLLQAEYTFYWNVLSVSSLFRLLNHSASFFFDQGHVALSMPDIYQRQIDMYYHGFAPKLLNQNEPLKLSQLQGLAQSNQSVSKNILQYHQTSPSPDQLVEHIMSTRQ